MELSLNTAVFWLACVGVFYAYVGYPLLLAALARYRPRPVATAPDDYLPPVTLIMPVHNEVRVIPAKLGNLAALDYPRAKLRIVIISDGSTDNTKDIVRQHGGTLDIVFDPLPQRQGKAAALNRGLTHVRSDLVVFTDASIMLRRDALRAITQPFRDPAIGCVSGEDHIADGSGEGLYGRYELFLRSLESRVSSLAGASGSFYAIRASLCPPFIAGAAPDFLSVLNTVDGGYRAISEPRARGTMASTKDTRREFERKTRTLIRGMTALWLKRGLLNPFRYGLFAWVLWSHKIMRWLVPVWLGVMLLTSAALYTNAFYAALFVAQLIFYGLAILGWLGPKAIGENRFARIAVFFTIANAAILVAWLRFLAGERLELWQPTQR